MMYELLHMMYELLHMVYELLHMMYELLPMVYELLRMMYELPHVWSVWQSQKISLFCDYKLVTQYPRNSLVVCCVQD